MEQNKDKKEEEYAAELTPHMLDFGRRESRAASRVETDEDGLGFFRGIFFGTLMAIPLWALIIRAIGRLFNR